MLDHFEIGEIDVFVDISVSSFNFANMKSKNIVNLAAISVTLTSCSNTVFPVTARSPESYKKMEKKNILPLGADVLKIAKVTL